MTFLRKMSALHAATYSLQLITRDPLAPSPASSNKRPAPLTASIQGAFFRSSPLIIRESAPHNLRGAATVRSQHFLIPEGSWEVYGGKKLSGAGVALQPSNSRFGPGLCKSYCKIQDGSLGSADPMLPQVMHVSHHRRSCVSRENNTRKLDSFPAAWSIVPCPTNALIPFPNHPSPMHAELPNQQILQPDRYLRNPSLLTVQRTLCQVSTQKQIGRTRNTEGPVHPSSLYIPPFRDHHRARSPAAARTSHGAGSAGHKSRQTPPSAARQTAACGRRARCGT